MIVRFFDTLDSTSSLAKEEAAKGAESGMVIVADCQTAGRGRRGREWNSPGGKNLYFSLLLRPNIAPDKAAMLTLVMGLAVSCGIGQAIAEICGNESGSLPRPMIKWPNDIVMNGKKVCGILTEMGMKQNAVDYIVIGVGINVHKQRFESELVDKATDLETVCGQRIKRKELLSKVLDCFEDYYAVFAERGDLRSLRGEYESLLVNRNREVCVLDPQGEYRGIATGITDTGELCVKLPDGNVTEVYAGEVSVRGIYGYV